MPTSLECRSGQRVMQLALTLSPGLWKVWMSQSGMWRHCPISNFLATLEVASNEFVTLFPMCWIRVRGSERWSVHCLVIMSQYVIGFVGLSHVLQATSSKHVFHNQSQRLRLEFFEIVQHHWHALHTRERSMELRSPAS